MRHRLRGCPGEGRAELGLTLVLLLALVPGWAEAVVAPELEDQGWRELPNPNKAENAYAATGDGAIEVVSDNSVSTLYRPVHADIQERPILTWRWRVEEPAPATDLSSKGEDDCSLAVYVGFPYEPDQASFFERLKRPLVESMAGEEAPGRVLRYTFCGAHQRGEVVESPHLGAAGFVRVLRPTDSATSEWFTERVDIAADYREAFGEDPPDPVQIAIQADTDDTRSTSRALVADLAFQPRSGWRTKGPAGRSRSAVLRGLFACHGRRAAARALSGRAPDLGVRRAPGARSATARGPMREPGQSAIQ